MCFFFLNRYFSIGSDQSMESLFYHFMDELLFLYGSEYFMVKNIEIVDLNLEAYSIRCRCWGEKFDHKRHSQGKRMKQDR